MSFSTHGNSILNEKGEPIRLKGVSRSGLEYAYADLDAMIPETIAFDIQLMKQWGFNAIRFPLRDVFWLKDMRYRQTVQYWVEQTLQNNMFVILDYHTQQDHPGLDPFMFRKKDGGLDMWVDLAKTYKDTPHVFFEVFNEPHDISPQVWWDGDSQYYGYNEVLAAIRKHAPNLCLIGGLDYAYQFNFLQQNDTLLREMKSVSNLVLSVHPYGYKGIPTKDGVGTTPIPTTLLPKPSSLYTGDCSGGVSVPIVPLSQYGWEESFGFLVTEKMFPVIATEWGLDRPDNCVQGGWYNIQILDYMNSKNMSYMAWAWVQDRLDYPSLLDENFQPTGHGTRDTVGPACSGPLNKYYQGPGVLVWNDLRPSHQRMLLFSTPPVENFFLFRNILCLFLIFFGIFQFIFLFHIPEKKKEPTPDFHRVVSNTKLHDSIRIRSSHSLLQLK